MHIGFSVKRIREHITILQEEKQVAELLLGQLTDLKIQSSIERLAYIDFIENHLNIVSKQIEYIKNRILLLESMADKFSALNLFIAELLNDAKTSIRSIEDIGG